MKINEIITEGKTGPGLWAHIHAKRKRGAKMRKKGAPGAPTEKALKAAQAGSKNESVQQGEAEGNDDITRLRQGEKTSDNIIMPDIRLMAGEGELTDETILQALVVIRKHRAERGVAEAAGSPSFRKGQKVLIVKQGVIATVTKIDKKWGYITVQTNDGRMAQIDERQFNQIKAYHGPMLSPSVTSEITELLNNGTSPDDVADIMSLPVEVVAEFMPNQQGVAEGWKQKVGAGLTAAAMATGAGGVVLNPARPIGPKGQTVANPYPNKGSNTKSPDDAWAKIEKRKAAEKKKPLEETYDNDDEFFEAYGVMEYNDEMINESEYQGRKVTLNKPMQGDVKKFKVYVKNPKGNVVKVNFGDPNSTIKKNNPSRRKSFRARHNCDNPGPKTGARYWSCRKW